MRILTLFAILGGISIACTDLNETSDLENKVQALQSKIPTLNSNIEALYALMQDGILNNAAESNGIWTITLGNGNTQTLTVGNIGVGNTPVLSVDDEGYWMVDYSTGASHLLNGTAKVKAVGTDSIIPVFSVDASGNWTVSFDGGNTFAATENTVSALPSDEVQDSFFENVVLADNKLEITLRGQESFSIPVVADFRCTIEAEGPQMFKNGQTKLYNVNLNGVQSTNISVPYGWTAALNEPVDGIAVLVVTAPITEGTTPINASLEVCIRAFYNETLSTTAKMQVKITDDSTIVIPAASVFAGEAGETSLIFNVATSNATSWKYILLKKGETAPDAGKLALEGIEGNDKTVTVEGLECATTYTLYVLPINGDVLGTVASVDNTTLQKVIEGYYDLYETGETITVGGRSFNKAVDGEAVLMEADGEITTNGIYFLKEGVTASYTGTGNIKKLAVIGDKDGVRSTFKGPVNAYMKLKGDGDGYVIFDNLVIDHTATTTQYFMTVNANEQFPLVSFENCEIRRNSAKGFIYISNASRSIGHLSLVDCEYATPETDQQYILSSGSAKTPAYGTVTVDNCIFYSKSKSGRSLNLCSAAGATFEKIVFTNNTFVNILAHNKLLFNCVKIDQATVTGNIMYISSDITIDGSQHILQSKDEVIKGGTINSNIGYTGQENRFLVIYGGSEKWFDGVEEVEMLNTDPFTGGTFDLENGRFIPGSEYAKYGAKR